MSNSAGHADRRRLRARDKPAKVRRQKYGPHEVNRRLRRAGMYMWRPMIAAVIATGLLSTGALAEPKKIIVENCAKVEVQPYADIVTTGNSYLTRVICTGQDAKEPKVVPDIYTPSSNFLCLDSRGCGVTR